MGASHSSDPSDKTKAEWIEQSKHLEAQQSVYILTLAWIDKNAINFDLSSDDPEGDPAVEMVGIYNSKAAAVADSVTVCNFWDRRVFDDAIQDWDLDHPDYVDNRMDPPDDGILWKIFYPCKEKDQYCELRIKKHAIMGLEEKQKATKVNDNSCNENTPIVDLEEKQKATKVNDNSCNENTPIVVLEEKQKATKVNDNSCHEITRRPQNNKKRKSS